MVARNCINHMQRVPLSLSLSRVRKQHSPIPRHTHTASNLYNGVQPTNGESPTNPLIIWLDIMAINSDNCELRRRAGELGSENRVSYLDPVGRPEIFGGPTAKGRVGESETGWSITLASDTRAGKRSESVGNDAVCKVARGRERHYRERKLARPLERRRTLQSRN